MYYNTLGNLAYYDTSGNPEQPGWGLTNTGPFGNFIGSYYWTSTPYAPNPSSAWYTFLGSGLQNVNAKTLTFYAWAVHDGDISAVPIPAAIGLFGSGLIGLIGVARRKKV